MSEVGTLTEKIPEWKKKEIEKFEELIDEYEAIGVVNVEGIASKQFQEIRKNLHGSAKVRVGRNTLMRRALESKGLGDLTEYVKGQTGLLLTNDNPFKLYKAIEESKSPAPIKAGQVAPNDIVVSEGDTGFDPGPFVGDLQQAGVNARIEGGSIKVMEDSVVAREGEEVSDQVAEVLQKLDIYPIEVGLELRAVLEDGTLFDPETLDIDEDEYKADLEAAAAGAYNLAINATVVNSTTVRPLIGKADSEARSLGVEAEVFEPEIIQQLVSNAYAGVKGLASQLDDEVLPEELRGVETGVEETEGEEEEEEADEEAGETEKDEAETEVEAGDEQEEVEEEEEGDEDEDISEGMGDLFG